MNDPIQELQKLIDQSSRIVFFGGAGVSTESGVPDFRSVDGLYSQRFDERPETILSHSYFVKHPEQFFKFHREKMLFPDAKPNAAHRKLAELEAAGKLSAVITQNIDGLHQAAGSKQVLELHGSVWRNYCMDCGATYSLEWVLGTTGVPRCEQCGGIVRPDVVLYEEALDSGVMARAVSYLRAADLVIVGGTSLVVYPAAGLLRYTRAPIVLINKSATTYDDTARLVIAQPIGEVLGQIAVR
jgi:NAD-dependent deacetylase